MQTDHEGHEPINRSRWICYDFSKHELRHERINPAPHHPASELHLHCNDHEVWWTGEGPLREAVSLRHFGGIE
eukprot:6522313-Pyramimonas_sp.AAC.1